MNLREGDFGTWAFQECTKLKWTLSKVPCLYTLTNTTRLD